MSYMSIDLKSLKDIEKKINTLSRNLGRIGSSFSSTRRNIDLVVRNRSGIDSQMSSLIVEINEKERVINNVKVFLEDTFKQYEDMEKTVILGTIICME